MALLQISRLSKQYGSKILLEDADAHLDPGYRVALIGPNGSGKTTLLRMLLGLEEFDSGQVTKQPSLRIGHLAQEVGVTAIDAGRDGRAVLAEVIRMDGTREALVRERTQVEARLTANHSDEEALYRLGHLLEELERMDEYTLESRAKTLLLGFGFAKADFSRPLSEFSGGWLMRIQLARILLAEPDVLVLDEPTNHLDLESLLWLEEFLQSFRGALLVVSHDRVFLNRIATHVWELENRKINVYRGNIDGYVTQKEERMAVVRAQYVNQQARIAELERFVERFRA
ncbi:MAG: ATP-binding cassette domain-containing protein, partial [Bdellovibrionota bacterium]